MSDTVIMGKRDKRDDRLTFRVPTTLRVAIERAAERDRRSVSDWIVIALTDAVKSKGGK
jgi:uncharacterized protein (DUF1778 family)